MEYTRETPIAAPPEAVFAFHERPGALARLTPPWERVEIIAGGDSLRPGSRVVLRTKVGPLALTWIAEHTAYNPPHLFADRQVSGPFARWEHAHRFLPDGHGGTLLRDEVSFDPPFGRLGRWLLGRFLQARIDRLFAFRHEATRQLVETPECPPSS